MVATRRAHTRYTEQDEAATEHGGATKRSDVRVWCGVTACGHGWLHRMRANGAPHTATRPVDLSLHILKRQCGRRRRPPTLRSSARSSHTSARGDGGRDRWGRVGSWGYGGLHTRTCMGVRPVVVRPDRRRGGGRHVAGGAHAHTHHFDESSRSSNAIRKRYTHRAALAPVFWSKRLYLLWVVAAVGLAPQAIPVSREHRSPRPARPGEGNKKHARLGVWCSVSRNAGGVVGQRPASPASHWLRIWYL